jgi:predicted RNA methylase
MATAMLFDFEAVQQTSGDAKIADRFRRWAEALQPKIDHAGRSMTQNPTPKRNQEYQSRMHDCRNMERTQKALRVLADEHEAGTVPGSLAGLKTRDEVAAMVKKYIDSGKGGYYSVIEADDFHDTTPAARLLQGMIEGNSAQRAERERVRRIEALEAEIQLTKIPGYFPTPAPVVSIMLDRARIHGGLLVLEPSAGNGNIADAIRAKFSGVAVHCFEWNLRLAEILKLKGYALIGSDFMEATGSDIFDRVVMNPPFERQQDIDHVRKAFSLLKAGGVLVSVMAPGFEFRQDRKSTEFRAWLDEVGGTWEDLPDGAFKQSGTGISTRLVVIEK